MGFFNRKKDDVTLKPSKVLTSEMCMFVKYH